MKKTNYFRKFIRFGKKGDITPLLGNKEAFKKAIDEMTSPFLKEKIDKVVSNEARGFIFGGAIADRLNVAFVPIRKKGNLPCKTFSISAKTYTSKIVTLEIHQDALKPGERILLVDDWFEVGGQAKSAIKLIEKLGGVIVGISVLVDETPPKVKDFLSKYHYHYLIKLEDN